MKNRLKDTCESKAEALRDFSQKEKLVFKRGRIIFYVLIVLGVITGAALCAYSVLQISVASQAAVGNVYENGALPYLIMLLGAALCAVCYLLTKGIAGARIAYSVCTGCSALLALAVIMTGRLEPQLLVPLLIPLAAAIILLTAATVIMATSKGIKEYMYDLEIKSSDIDK